MYLKDIAKVIRSKNAGPRCTTLDIIFNSAGDYDRVVQSQVLNLQLLSELYATPAAAMDIFEYPLAHAIKIVIPRKVTAGNPGDRDVYGAQQHARLLKVKI